MLPPIAWYLTLTGVIALGSIFWIVAAGASHKAPPVSVQTARIRRLCTWALGLLAFPITLASLSYAPLVTEAAIPAGTESVEVVGHQWFWELSQTQVPAGELIEFKVTSADVNHGFAIYDPESRLIAQTQAMPGYTNSLQVRFEEPGTYKILCLEYCGLVHHGMSSTIEVIHSQHAAN